MSGLGELRHQCCDLRGGTDQRDFRLRAAISGRSTFLAVVKATDLQEGNHAAGFGSSLRGAMPAGGSATAGHRIGTRKKVSLLCV